MEYGPFSSLLPQRSRESTFYLAYSLKANGENLFDCETRLVATSAELVSYVKSTANPQHCEVTSQTAKVIKLI